ncbi:MULTISPECIES: peptidase U32 family protein [Staphylococcus]|uniref:U32 family peptidase n=1 Tax=Staphylococcus hominis TaxID=1290 RepID=A0A4V6MZG5_STAHO|nr:MULTISPECIES: peptidase U32 family protein [Staphylococcus]EUZ70523.1 U32 family peptidase [Staphylococcus sp. M0480]OFM59110.1 peptidase U32 [Staphylococcus sp. HMSC059G05]OFM61921.1 peptidase U32 [Staphylococcus sp. HMSC062C01]OFM62311.1 peptidase U32 [Staphylococcus sp. HMSC068D07]OFM77484.1 peptidase U32 [Staphylococcus sp. HMSC074B09]OFM93380.1 peptidase U32 [Staphylococcus sp. HMSC078D05]OFN12837.1 peptidase U32 [Staphylococcus sp. HMSC058D09]OFR10671.1 peptidase U32 [Staphylococcu
MTELLVTPKSLNHMKTLIELGADAFVIGEQKFGLRLPGEFNREDVRKAVNLAHEHDKKVYVAVNGIFHNYHLNALENYIEFLHEIRVDRIIFGDPAVVMYVKKQDNPIPLNWDAETIVTNYFQCNYWGGKGAKRAVLARELNLDEILNIKKHANVEIEVQVHGMTCMFQSKRMLLGNYYTFQDRQMKIQRSENDQDLLLYDEERENKYPVFEDYNGTHIMSPNDICLIEELEPFFEANIDSFKIDGILQSEAYINTVTAQYREAIDLYHEDPEAYEDEKFMLIDPIEEIQPEHRPFDEGFLYKQTVY